MDTPLSTISQATADSTSILWTPNHSWLLLGVLFPK